MTLKVYCGALLTMAVIPVMAAADAYFAFICEPSRIHLCEEREEHHVDTPTNEIVVCERRRRRQIQIIDLLSNSQCFS
jgi:hypothetical protein